MPVRTVTKGLMYDRQELVDQLASEWQAPTDSEDAPLILVEDTSGRGAGEHGYIHFVVVWDAWSSVPAEERSAIVMDAYRQTKPELERLRRVTIAMAITREDALRMGFPDH